MHGCDDKAILESTLSWKVDATLCKIWIELTEIAILASLELCNLILVDVKRLLILLCVDDLRFPFFNRLIQQSVADEIDKSVLIHTRSVV